MKKYLLLILIFATILMAQYTYTFPEYMEKLQRDVPTKAIDWFSKNAYSTTYNVSRDIFMFYRGISEYYSYVHYRGSTNELNKALSDFRYALEIPYDAKYNFNTRALLYIGGILTIQSNNTELASLIFKEYADNAVPYDDFYPTSLYWSLYLGFLDKSTYTLYYQRLEKIAENELYPSRIIFDYFVGEYSTLNQMMRKLYYPEEYVQKSYKELTARTDVYQAIRKYIKVLPEDPNLSKYGAYQYIYFEEYPPKNRILNSRVSEKANNDRIFTNMTTNNNNTNIYRRGGADTNTIRRDNTNTIRQQPPVVSPQQQKQSNSFPLTILVNTKESYGNVKISIAGSTFNTTKSQTFNLNVKEGRHTVVVSFLGNTYTNSFNVNSRAYNLLSIVIQRNGVRTSGADTNLNKDDYLVYSK